MFINEHASFMGATRGCACIDTAYGKKGEEVSAQVAEEGVE